MPATALDLAASHAGITPEQAREAVASALRSLHKVARIDPMNLTAAAIECRASFGSEACFHLFGLLEVGRLESDPGLPWSQTLRRLDPRMTTYMALVDRWLAGDGDPEPA